MTLILPDRDSDADDDRTMTILLPGDQASIEPVSLRRRSDGTWEARMYCAIYRSDNAADCWDWLRRLDGPGAAPLLAFRPE